MVVLPDGAHFLVTSVSRVPGLVGVLGHAPDAPVLTCAFGEGEPLDEGLMFNEMITVEIVPRGYPPREWRGAYHPHHAPA